MRLVFIATGDIALPALRHLIARGPRPLALVTQPDKPAGRHQRPCVPMVKTVALEAGIPVFQPARTGDAAADLAALDPDVLVVMAYGQILRDEILNLPRKAVINLHASLLPRYRGAACIQAAIDAGDAETGVTSLHVTRALDAGDVILARSIPIAADETGGSLHDRLADLAVPVLAGTLDQIAAGTAPRVPQDESASSLVRKLGREDGRIRWNQSAAAIERRIRAYDPWPGTFTTFIEGGREKRLKIFPPVRITGSALAAGEIATADGSVLVGCGGGALALGVVQPEGGRRMDALEFVRGRHLAGFL